MKMSFGKSGIYVILSVVILVILMLNSWLSSRIRNMEQPEIFSRDVKPVIISDTSVPSIVSNPDFFESVSVLLSVKPDQPAGVFVRRTMIDPSRKFMRNVIMNGGQEIALFKSDGENIFDVVGKIPDGKLDFIDDYAGTFGAESFLNGQRHGEYLEYYPDKSVRRKKMYEEGSVTSLEEYFSNSQLRMAVDYKDAILIGNESGTGRIFNNEGQLLYEWRLTAAGEHRYRKFYNKSGGLVEYLRYDVQGRVLEHQKPSEVLP